MPRVRSLRRLHLPRQMNNDRKAVVLIDFE
jgi:hypothetical protein